MANKRAGLIEAPTATVQTPNLGSGATHPAVTQAYEDLSKAAASIGKMVQPAVDANTEREARAAVARGDYKTTMGLTRQDEIYDKIVDAGYMAQASMDVDRTIGELTNKHLSTLNMEEFQKDNEAARTLYLENADPRHAPALAIAWDQQALQASQRLSGIATQKAIKLADERLVARVSQLEDEVSGASDPTDFQVAYRIAEIKEIQKARVAKGDISEEEANAGIGMIYGRMTANKVSDTAVAYYAENGYSDKAYADALKMIDDAMASPELTLSRTERSAYFSAAKTQLNAQRSEIRAREREFQAQLRQHQSDALSQFSIDYADAKGRAGEGYGPSREELAALYEVAGQTRNPAANIAKVNDLARTAQIQEGMRSLSIPEQERYLQTLEQDASNGDVEAARQLDAARKVTSNSRRAAEADPATYAALREKRDVPKIDWSTADGMVETMAKRFDAAAIASQDLGVAPKYFSPADRTQLRAITDRGGADALKAVNGIVQAADRAGIDPIRVMEEIDNGGAPLMAIAGRLISGGADPSVAAKVLSGKAAMGSELVKKQMPDGNTQKSVQLSVLGHVVNQMTPEQTDAYTRAFDAYMAADLLENNGERRGGAKAHYEMAARAVIGESKDVSGRTWGGITKHRDQTVTVPPWMTQAQFSTTVSNLTETDLKRSVGPLTTFTPTLGKYKGRDATVADYRSAALTEIPPLGSGMYYVAPDPSRPREYINLNGHYAILNLNSIREDLKTRYASTVR